MVQMLKTTDETLEDVARALAHYESENAGSVCTLYRYNPGAIRVRVVDPQFRTMSKGERHDFVWDYFDPISDDAVNEISVLLCLAPEERPYIDFEFPDE